MVTGAPPRATRSTSALSRLRASLTCNGWGGMRNLVQQSWSSNKMSPGVDTVTCASCGQGNREGRKFCAGCGTPLAVACTACGTANEHGEKFCGECGVSLQPKSRSLEPAGYTPKHLAEKILGSRGTLEGERKQVTVLFADVKGSMELAEQVDPEDWHRIIDRFSQLLAEGVHRFEGTVNQYTGDGIMALFGAPIAHEDHAQRACWAALHLRGELRRYAEEVKRTH